MSISLLGDVPFRTHAHTFRYAVCGYVCVFACVFVFGRPEQVVIAFAVN